MHWSQSHPPLGRAHFTEEHRLHEYFRYLDLKPNGMSVQLVAQLNAMRSYFDSGATLPYAFRKAQLDKLKLAIRKHEKELYNALYADLKKSPEESWVTEVGFVMSEINASLKNLHRWMRPEKKATNLVNIPSSSFVVSEPLGVVLIIGPWNYPFQLLFTPLVGAIAAGNVVVLKPSEFAPASAAVMETIIKEIFDPEQVVLLQGDGATIIPEMMNNFRFNHVFYTGSTAVGKSIYQMAASQLVPVTLELGGKSPCVVESDADIKLAAKRIAVTKFSNAGQMCVAPDYVLVHENVKEKFIDEMKKVIPKFFSADPASNYNYGKIINEKQFNRLVSYLNHGNILYGGNTDREKLYVSPTLIDPMPLADNQSNPLLKEEIFGPILPVISYNLFEEAKAVINRNPDPLAFYLFTSSSRNEKKWLHEVAFGGGCVNNASWQLTNHHLPFGGRGNSGIGHYHGKYSFNTFSHKKAVMKTPTWFDPAVKYPPFKGKLGFFKKIIG